MGAIVREHGNPIPIVPKPIRETMGPSLPRGRIMGESFSMFRVMLMIVVRGKAKNRDVKCEVEIFRDGY